MRSVKMTIGLLAISLLAGCASTGKLSSMGDSADFRDRWDELEVKRGKPHADFKKLFAKALNNAVEAKKQAAISRER